MKYKDSSQENTDTLSFYSKNEALLYQFFLHECYVTFRKLHEEKLSEAELFQILGTENKKITPWRAAKGHLQKIDYYYSFMMSTMPQHPLVKKLGTTIQKALSSAQDCLETFLANSREFSSHLKQLKKEIKKMGLLLFGKLQDYKNNEYVLLFFVRNHKEFDFLFGKPTVAKTLDQLFPGGIEEVGKFLCEKYSKKGFHHLLATIEENISILKSHV